VISPVWGHVTGVVTVVLMVTFVAIWVWAWRRQHRATFQRMAALPMEDGASDGENASDGEKGA
jgi:cytochrome c oxidase cbb3-type subunit 4